MTSPTQRTLAECKRLGWTCQVVEHWNQYGKVRQDLFGCIDIVACTGDGILGIQACAGASHAARMTKALAEPRLVDWMRSGGLFEVWSWSELVAYKKDGKKAIRGKWTLRRERIATWSSTGLVI